LLIAVADRLRAGLRGMDVAARLGGDEFTVLLPGIADAGEAAAVAARLATAIREPIVHGDRELAPTASFGVVIGHAGRADAAELLRSADAAMYRAKHGDAPERIVVDG
ncbi:MAG TPA: GGDEF domain-containing protein, partial [Kofleriaceae bacterium]|nr:GGDEF domain-containing protein [Kofleriaceae bacterium]